MVSVGVMTRQMEPRDTKLGASGKQARHGLHMSCHLDGGSRREACLEPPGLPKSALEVSDATALHNARSGGAVEISVI